MPYLYLGDPMWLFLMLAATGLGLFAQYKVKSTFEKYAQVRSQSGLTGEQVAQRLLAENDCRETSVRPIGGALSDHFDPRTNVVSLSEPVYGSSSISAQAVAAHECGHVMQHEQGYGPMGIRSLLVPVANFGSSLAWPIFFIGIISSINIFMSLGIAFFAFAVLFHLVTLPVELNASSRALRALESGGYLAREEIGSARAVLNAAALTYVAGALASIAQLLRLLSIANSRRR